MLSPVSSDCLDIVLLNRCLTSPSNGSWMRMSETVALGLPCFLTAAAILLENFGFGAPWPAAPPALASALSQPLEPSPAEPADVDRAGVALIAAIDSRPQLASPTLSLHSWLLEGSQRPTLLELL